MLERLPRNALPYIITWCDSLFPRQSREEPELFDEAFACSKACEEWARKLGKVTRLQKVREYAECMAGVLIDGDFDGLIERSSLGTLEAKAIRAQADPEQVQKILDRADRMRDREHVEAFRPGLHKHYKGAHYRALFLARDHESQAPLVVYIPLTPHSDEKLPSPPQVRALCSGKDAWNDEVPVVDRVVRRFTWIAP